MQLSLYQWDGKNINDGTNYTAVIPIGQTMPMASPRFVDRGQSWSYLAGKDLSGSVFTIKVIMRGDISSQLETLKYWFRTDDFVPRKLVAQDTADSNLKWYIEGYPITGPTMPSGNGSSEVIIQLAIKDPLWREYVVQTDSWGVTASGQTHAMTVKGNYEALPTLKITVNGQKSGGFLYKRYVNVYNNSTRPLGNYPLCVTGTGLNTSALVGASKMLASGNDLRVYVDGAEVERWLYNMNTTATMVWINLSMKAKLETTKGITTAIAASGVVAKIYFNATYEKTFLTALPSSGLLMIDNELFDYNNVNSSAATVDVIERASRGSALALHAVGALVRFIEHDVCIQYGSSGISAPSNDDSRKPIIDLDANSSNTQWKYSNFGSVSGLRKINWTKLVYSGGATGGSHYTGHHLDTEADPFTEMGLHIKAYQAGTAWKSGAGDLRWNLAHPCGIATVTVNFDRYKATSNWPTATIDRSADNTTWAVAATIATPTAGAWSTVAATAVSIASYPYMRIRFTGGVSNVANNYAALEVDDLTLTLGALVPTVTVGAENTDNYSLNATIENTTTGDSISISNFPLAIGQTATINCADQTIKSSNGANLLGALDWNSNRSEWLTIMNGDVMKYTETGVTNVAIALEWAGRNLI